MNPHPDKAKMDALFPAIREYEALAKSHGIADIFQDNGGKLLQLILTLNLKVAPVGRALMRMTIKDENMS